MRAFILAVNGVMHHRFRAMSLVATAVAVILSCKGLTPTGPQIDTVVVALTTSRSSVGQTISAAATIRDNDGLRVDGIPITWSLSNPAVGSIASSGNNAEITTIGAGTTEVSATAGGRVGTAALTVDPAAPAPVASTSVYLAASSLIPGQSTQATATTRDASNNVLTGRAVAWSSTNNSVATVSTAGLVTAVAVGSADITATSEGRSGSATITVSSTPPAAVASVSVSLGASSRNPGQTTQATATTRDANNNVLTGRAISWASSNSAIATVSGSGLVTAVAAGSAQITATSEGQNGSATFTVTAAPPVPVASVTVSLAASSRNPGQTTQATATTRDANNNVLTGRVVSWSSSNTSIATVSTSGLVTAVAAGSAQITATSEGQSGNATLTVNAPPPPAPVASVTVSLPVNSLIPGQTTQATATTRDANGAVLTGRAISWSSSNNALATVSSSGLVTAVAIAAVVQITATSEGVAGSATVAVVAAPPPGSSNEPAGMTLITERAFDALGEGGWYDQPTANLYLEQDALAPRSPSSIITQKFAAGFGGGGSAAVLEKGLGRKYTTIYISYWIKYSANWYGHPTSGVNKQMHVWINGGNHVFTQAYGAGTGGLKAEIWLQGTAGPPSERNLYSNLGNPGTITRGKWHKWEVLLKCNTNGAADGSVEWWIDGVKIGEYFDVRLEPSTSYWETIQWSPTWGGTGSTTPADQFESLDHIYISGKN